MSENAKPWASRHFIYLLNAFEEAAQHERPASLGYAGRRKALCEYVANLENTCTPPLHDDHNGDLRTMTARTETNLVGAVQAEAGK